MARRAIPIIAFPQVQTLIIYRAFQARPAPQTRMSTNSHDNQI